MREVLSISTPVSQKTFAWNPATSTTTVTDDIDGVLSSATQFKYDVNKRLIQKVDALGGTTDFTYFASGERASLTDARGNVTSFTYDAKGNLLSITDDLGNVTTHTYDATFNKLDRWLATSPRMGTMLATC